MVDSLRNTGVGDTGNFPPAKPSFASDITDRSCTPIENSSSLGRSRSVDSLLEKTDTPNLKPSLTSVDTLAPEITLEDRKIEVVAQKASYTNEEIQELRRLNNEIESAEDRLQAKSAECAQKLKEIRTAAAAEIRELDNKRHFNAARRGLPSAAVASRIGKSEAAVKEIVAKAESDAKAILLDFKKSILEEQEIITSFLLEKAAIRQKAQGVPSEDTLEKSQNFFADANEAAFFGANQKESTDAFQYLAAADSLRFLALGNLADEETTAANEQLDAIEDSLASLLHEQPPADRKFSSHKIIAEAKEAFEKNRADFLFTEARSDQAAGAIAKERAEFFFAEAERIKSLANNTQNDIEVARDQDKPSLQRREAALSSLANHLEKTALAYDQLSDAYTVEVREIAKVEDSLFSLEQQRKEKDLTTLISEEIELSLSEAHKKRSQDQSQYRPSDIDLLTQFYKMSTLTKSIITGNRGVINFSRLPDPITEKDRREYHNGMSLIKQAVLRDFGIYGVQRFEERFAGKMDANNPLFMSDLQSFITAEQNRGKEAYFISSIHPLEDILATDFSEADSDRVIKSDGYNMALFNPFSKASIVRATTVTETEASKEGFKVTRKALTNYLKKENVADQYIASIHKDFDKRFSSNDAEVLTIGALKTFVNEQREKGRFSTVLIPSYRINSFLFHSIAALGEGVRNTAIFLHGGMIPAMFSELFTGMLNDFTLPWREPPDLGHHDER